jgi:hypothetical protein
MGASGPFGSAVGPAGSSPSVRMDVGGDGTVASSVPGFEDRPARVTLRGALGKRQTKLARKNHTQIGHCGARNELIRNVLPVTRRTEGGPARTALRDAPCAADGQGNGPLSRVGDYCTAESGGGSR